MSLRKTQFYRRPFSDQSRHAEDEACDPVSFGRAVACGANMNEGFGERSIMYPDHLVAVAGHD